jgi:hypothetical protein
MSKILVALCNLILLIIKAAARQGQGQLAGAATVPTEERSPTLTQRILGSINE